MQALVNNAAFWMLIEVTLTILFFLPTPIRMIQTFLRFGDPVRFSALGRPAEALPPPRKPSPPTGNPPPPAPTATAPTSPDP